MSTYNPIEDIIQFNKKAGLLDSPYDDFLESSFQIEEALEGFDCSNYIDIGTDVTRSHKDLSRLIIASVQPDITGKEDFTIYNVDRLDKALDAIVYAIGSCAKLGLNQTQITAALQVVMEHNNTKLGMPKDAHGKLIKPDGFVGPEAKLQLILDSNK